jgi:hypothetical protein
LVAGATITHPLFLHDARTVLAVTDG